MNYSEKTEIEILRQQLELLAERSQSASDEALVELTDAMCQVARFFLYPNS